MRSLFLVQYLIKSIIYEQNNEVCCRCLTCRKKIHSETNFSDELDSCFNNLKKLLIQYYYVFNNKSFLLVISSKIPLKKASYSIPWHITLNNLIPVNKKKH